MPFYSFTFILLVACAIFFYRAGEFDGSSGMLWAALSVAISVVAWRVFGWAGWQFCSLRSASLLASLFFGWYASPEWTVRTPPLARSRASLPIQGAPKCATGPITASDRL